MSVSFGGYVETFYQWNFAKPANGITNYRGFDNRHNAFTLANVALDAQFRLDQVYGRLTGQVGHTPSTYYMAEPNAPGASGANVSDESLWKYLQQAFLGYRLPVRQVKVALEAGLFLSPIGVESMAIHESWNWSRSNLFFGLPFYHTGARLSVSPLEAWTLNLAVYNGWNSVVDNNEEKSVALQSLWDISTDVTLSLLYFGGVERAPRALEGEPFRHLFDVYLVWQVVDWFALKGQGNAGFERNRFGTSAWGAGALYARFSVRERFALALRGDLFYEHVPSSSRGRATPIFWPVSWVSSATATLEYRPQSYLSLRLEYRRDQAADALYYRGAVPVPGLPNSRAQDTLTVGATAWF